MATYLISCRELYAYVGNYTSWSMSDVTNPTTIPSPQALAAGDKIVFSPTSLRSGTEAYFGTPGTIGFSVCSQEGGAGAYDLALRCSYAVFTENWRNELSFTVLSVELNPDADEMMGMTEYYVRIQQDTPESEPSEGTIKVLGENAIPFLKEKMKTLVTDNLGKAKVLTSDDYNYPTANPDGVALWLLDVGLYLAPSGVKIYKSTSSSTTQSDPDTFLILDKGRTAIWKNYSTSSLVYFTLESTGNWYRTYPILDASSVVDSLTSTSTTSPLSANQGKVLKDMIDNLPTGGVTELTSADNNWPLTGTKVGIAYWLLPDGIYHSDENVYWYRDASVNTGKNRFVLVETVDSYYKSATFIETDEIAFLKNNNTTGASVSGFPHTVLKSSQISQSTGTSTSMLMSQNAVTSMVFADPSTKYRVQIGADASTTDDTISIGHEAYSNGWFATALGAYKPRANFRGSTALGSFASTNAIGEMNIGLPLADTSQQRNYGYRQSAYRLLTGLYDGQSAHDAATYGQVISYAAINGAGAPTTATEGKYVGQLYYDTTNEAMYFLKTIDTTTTPATYTWEAIGGGPTVVQTTGTSTTDVMSQNAVTSMVYADPSQRTKVNIGGTVTGLVGTALGTYSFATGAGSVALGSYSDASSTGQVSISTRNTTYGYNNSNYRLLTGLYDPQSAHDAATKGYVDAAKANEINSTDWSALWQ